MIYGVRYQERVYDFTTKPNRTGENIFTVIVGKNGTGKSRLLRELVKSFIPEDFLFRERDLLALWSHDKGNEFKVKSSGLPNGIIALSTSPFDKFPIPKKVEIDGFYEYLGLRGLSSANLSLSFMSRIIGSLVRDINHNPDQAKTITSVLNYLGYDGYLEARLTMNPRRALEIINSDSIDRLSERSFYPGSPIGAYSKLNARLILLHREEIKDALLATLQENVKPRIDIVIDDRGGYENGTFSPLSPSQLLLIESGLYTLRDVGLRKKDTQEMFRINDASSGEQCVVMALLGIASHIRDGMLICIDEPEICLHPEWQEKFMSLLIGTFSNFRGCHFIVATHSPQIVANLEKRNCYVVSMETGVTTDAKDLHNRSADFQLARIFKAPGYKNEFLSRELISVLGYLGEGKIPTEEEKQRLEDMLLLKDVLEDGDPVKRLMTLLEEALREE